MCAPSESAMNGSKDQSFSVAGSVPSSPKHNSISGPLVESNRQTLAGIRRLPQVAAVFVGEVD
jgi:hypothetical protein